MKKHNEGYALPFVLVVLVVMCIISVGVMDFCLRNLQSQQNTIQRMEAKYEAAGKIEEIVAAMKATSAESVPVEFVGSLDFSSPLSFRINTGEGILRVAASHTQSSDGQQLWIIAAIEPENIGGLETLTMDQGQKSKLTVKYCGKTQYLWYEIVDLETAQHFLSSNAVDRYTPFSVNGGDVS